MISLKKWDFNMINITLDEDRCRAFLRSLRNSTWEYYTKNSIVTYVDTAKISVLPFGEKSAGIILDSDGTIATYGCVLPWGEKEIFSFDECTTYLLKWIYENFASDCLAKYNEQQRLQNEKFIDRCILLLQGTK